MTDILIGTDEAGRCPVIDPLVQTAVFCTTDADLEKLKASQRHLRLSCILHPRES